MADIDIEIHGLREFRPTLKRLAPEIDREIQHDLKGIDERLAAEARARAPRLTGEYARSIRATPTGVGSDLPQAGVLHWGGVIRPRGVPIVFPPRPVISDAIGHQTNRILDEMGDAIERGADKAGWHD